MDLTERTRAAGCIFLAILLAFGIGGMMWFLDLMGKESKNRYLLRELVSWSVDELRLHPELTIEGVAEAARERLGRSAEYRNCLKGTSVIDFWDTEVQFKILPGGEEFEWRSAGRDRKFETADDRFSRGKKGAVTAAPIGKAGAL